MYHIRVCMSRDLRRLYMLGTYYSNSAKYSNFKLIPQHVFIPSVRQLQFFTLTSYIIIALELE